MLATSLLQFPWESRCSLPSTLHCSVKLKSCRCMQLMVSALQGMKRPKADCRARFRTLLRAQAHARTKDTVATRKAAGKAASHSCVGSSACKQTDHSKRTKHMCQHSGYCVQSSEGIIKYRVDRKATTVGKLLLSLILVTDGPKLRYPSRMPLLFYQAWKAALHGCEQPAYGCRL